MSESLSTWLLGCIFKWIGNLGSEVETVSNSMILLSLESHAVENAQVYFGMLQPG